MAGLRGSRSLGLAGLNVEIVQRVLDFRVPQEDREDFRSESQRIRE